jgi:putative transcriptional regulator
MKKKNYVSDEELAEITTALERVVEHARGERDDFRTTLLPVPPQPMKHTEIVKLRERLNFTQLRFASALNVSLKTLQAWEEGRRQPKDTALKLLTIAKQHPEVFLT